MKRFYHPSRSYSFSQGVTPAVLVERHQNESMNLLELVGENERKPPEKHGSLA